MDWRYYRIMNLILLGCFILFLLRINDIFAQFRIVKSRKRSDSKKSSSSTDTTNLESEAINYQRLNLTKKFIDKIPCNSSNPCGSELFLDYHIARSTMVDNRRKILMEYTPKAGCTAAVTMFMNEMGFKQNEVYFVWPHTFREGYFYKRCGISTACMYEATDWYRFKVVRNPYDRIVSSYIHVMKWPIIQNKLIPPEKIETLSFEEFLELLLLLSPRVMQGLAGGHLGYQSQPYERILARLNQSLFNTIVYSENLKEGLSKINTDLNTTYQRGDRGIHLVHRHNETRYFVGNVSWAELKDRIPQDYGLFYNYRIKDLVEQIFIWDITLYKYKFPFTMVEESADKVRKSKVEDLPFHLVKIPEIKNRSVSLAEHAAYLAAAALSAAKPLPSPPTREHSHLRHYTKNHNWTDSHHSKNHNWTENHHLKNYNWTDHRYSRNRNWTDHFLHYSRHRNLTENSRKHQKVNQTVLSL